MLLLLFAPQPAPPSASYVSLGLVVSDLWPPLNAVGPADAVFWTEADLYQWCDDAVDALAGDNPIFVVYDKSLAAVNGQGAYTQPTTPEFISTLQADLAGKVLRARNIQQLEALDDSWPTTAATAPKPVEAFALDSKGLLQFLLYPIPGASDDGHAIGQVMQVDPVEITGPTLLAAPACLREYFTFYVLAEARAKETRAQMPEISNWFRGLLGVMDKAIAGYWGAA